MNVVETMKNQTREPSPCLVGKECVDQHGGQPYPGTVTLSDDHIVRADPTDAGPGCRIFEGEFRQKVGFILLVIGGI